MANLFETLTDLLEQDKRFLSSEGELLKNVVYEAAYKNDIQLLKILHDNKITHSEFFTTIDNDLEVFNTVKFGWVINNKQFLPDSYTRFANKIGLTDSNDEFLSKNNDVVLAFPHKDCILEGGQTKEDQKKDEIFYNQTLIPDEVNTLLAPKVLVNATKYTKDKQEKVTIVEDTDNLIINGNNILVLSSLMKRYEGKIKCIYGDPPYNTGNDSFGYNDSFNHSTWLVMMKNRIEILRKLLRNDGFLLIQCDDNEMPYLKVLCDEIMGRDNFITSIVVKMSHLSGVKMSHVNKNIPKIKEFILFYSKSISEVQLNEVLIPVEWNEAFDRYRSYLIKDESEPDDCSKWIVKPLGAVFKSNGIDSKDINKVSEFCITHADCIFRTAPNNSEEFKKIPKDSTFRRLTSASGLIKLSYKGEEVIFSSERIREVNGKKVPTLPVSDIWTDIGINNLHNEGDVQLKYGKKPERIIHRIIELTTNEGDWILDPFLGSGTTCAVANKMNRHYIGIEQLDSHILLSLERMKSTIHGDDSGISKDIGWTGGGSFISCELAKLNYNYVTDITQSNDDNFLIGLYEKISKSSFISTKINPTEIQSYTKDFSELTIENKKKILLKMLDLNMLYVNKSDINDETYAISMEDKVFNRNFYGDN